MSKCIFPSMGSSSVKKRTAAVGAQIESFKIDFKVFLMKTSTGSSRDGFKMNVDKPDLVIGQI